MEKVRKITIIKTLSTSVAIIISIVHIYYPDIKVDSITLSLLVIAVLPWLAPIFKSVELPGGMKFELQDFKEIEEKADKAGMIDKDARNADHPKEYTFQIVAKEDPKLALAGLRIELEEKLRKIAYKNDLDMSHKGLGQMMKMMSENNLITIDERVVLADMVGLLNAAVHSKREKYDYSNVSWALDVGSKVLNSLDKRLGEPSHVNIPLA